MRWPIGDLSSSSGVRIYIYMCINVYLIRNSGNVESTFLVIASLVYASLSQVGYPGYI